MTLLWSQNYYLVRQIDKVITRPCIIFKYIFFQTVDRICMVNLYQLSTYIVDMTEKISLFLHIYLYVTPSYKHRFSSSLVRHPPPMDKFWGSTLVEGSEVFFWLSCLLLGSMTKLSVFVTFD